MTTHVSVRRLLTVAEIISAVLLETGADASDFFGFGRSERVVHARELAVHLCKTIVGATYEEIATAMHRPNHSSLVTAHRRFLERGDMWQSSKIAADLGPTVLARKKALE